jgi:hypothetical protein
MSDRFQYRGNQLILKRFYRTPFSITSRAHVIKIRIAAPAVENAANLTLMEFVAETLGVVTAAPATPHD